MTDQIVREVVVIFDWTKENEIKEQMEKCEARARKLAAKIGINRCHVTKLNSPHTISADEYPGWLIGPGAPKLETPRDVHDCGYHCLHQVIIRDQDWVDWKNRQNDS